MMTAQMMKVTTRSIVMLATLVALGAGARPVGALGTQDKPAPTPTPPPVPVKVEVVLSRFQGEKKISSRPFVLMPTADTRGGGYTTLRVGVDVPVGVTTTTRPAENGREGVTTTQPSYQKVGTNIDCRATPLGEGRFSVMVSVTDSSIFNPDSPASMGKPSENAAFRTFQASNTLTMRDGQTMLLTTATDAVTGDLLKIEVTFSVVK